MIIATARFGNVDVDAGRVITFARGILGFPRWRPYALLAVEQGSRFFWLQSTESADLAFVVTDPSLWEPTYAVSLRDDMKAELDASDAGDVQTMTIVNKTGRILTTNLLGPLLINRWTMAGGQFVMSEKRYQTRHPILDLPAGGT